MNFQDFNLRRPVAAGIKAAGWDSPTPIQAQAIPVAMKGSDILGLAQTGTGKTAAFALPMLHRLVPGPRDRVRALVLAPTRELAEQTLQEIRTLGRKTGLKSISVFGGVGMGSQKARLKKSQIVSACPGRLLDHINRGNADLSGVEMLVIDEADMMLDMGFIPDIRKIIQALPKKRQNLLFSATMPKEIMGLAGDVLNNPEIIRVGDSAPAETVSHAIMPVAQDQKTNLLMKFLENEDTRSVIVFTRTKIRAQRLGEKLSRAGYKSASLQGNLSQGRRKATMEGFRKGAFQVLVATDIAARGIDVTRVSHVINFDAPSTPDAYIHRIGRTGRAENTGSAYTLVTREDRAIIKAINQRLGSPIETMRMPGFDYAAKTPGKAKAGGARKKRHFSPRNKNRQNRFKAPSRAAS